MNWKKTDTVPAKAAMHARNDLRLARLLTAIAVCGLWAGRARAGDDDDLAADPLNVPESAEGMVVIRNLDVNIDNWLFGNRRFSDNPAQKLTQLLKVKADGIARAVGLSDAQKEKLMLAGQGDILRFLERVDEVKLKYKSGPMQQAAWNQVFLEIQPLREILLRNALFGGESLFAKIERTTFTPQQAAQYENHEHEQHLFQHRTRIVSTVARLSNYLGMRDDQRKQLVQVMLDKTQPQPLLDQADRDQLVGLALLSRLPEKDIRPIFDADQWRALQRLFERVPQTLPMLRQNGINLNGDNLNGVNLRKRKRVRLNIRGEVIPAERIDNKGDGS
jgi:hypothetical protein